MQHAENRREFIVGPAGNLECQIDTPTQVRGLAVLAHPHPLMGGTMDNKVIHTLARACVQIGLRAVRFNFRGVGASDGKWDEGRGEVDDLLAVIAHYRVRSDSGAAPAAPVAPFVLGGFSFGGYAAAQACAQLSDTLAPNRLILIAPATGRFDVATVPPNRTLVIHGEADDVVPLADALNWARPQTLPITVVPGVGHFFHGQLTVLKNLVLHDLRAALLPPPTASPDIAE